MHFALRPTVARAIPYFLSLTAWTVIVPTVAHGQTKPTVTVVNPIAAP